jgi:excisionase family DNA binding protein
MGQQEFFGDVMWLTPPQFAKRLGIDVSKVLTWIRNGELRAVNVAERVGGRPRWRISSTAIEEFIRRRESTPPPAPRRSWHNCYGPRKPPAIRESDGRLAKNIPHEERVRRMAVLMAARRSGQGAEWRPLVKQAVLRYAEKTGVEVAEEAVLALNSW